MSAALALRVADYICGLQFGDIPQPLVERAKDVLVHHLAIAVAGHDTAESRTAVGFLQTSGAARGQSTVIGRGPAASPTDAAFVHAVMMRSLRLEDVIVRSGIHPGPMIVPPAIAVGEDVKSSGRDVITAVVLGYDVMLKLIGAGWDRQVVKRAASHVFGAFGTTTVAAKLMGLDRRQTATALAYAGNLAAMVPVGFDSHQYGIVVRNGMTAAYLGQAGAPAPDDALEGPHGFYHKQLNGVPDDLAGQFDSLGKGPGILESVLKPHPCVVQNLVPIGLTRRLLGDHPLVSSDIDTIVVHRPPRFLPSAGVASTSANARAAEANDPGPWLSPDAAISSLPFALAILLSGGDLTLSCFHRYNDPLVLERAARVRFEPLDSGELLHHQVQIRLGDGRALTAEGGEGILDRRPDVLSLLDQARGAIGTRGTSLPTVGGRLDELDTLDELVACLR